jgi:tyrosine-protein phosphatase SIW14
MGWSIESVVSEYTTYAHPKVREVDVKYIHRFEVADLIGIIEPSFIKMPNVIKPRGEVIKPRPVSRSNKMRKMVLVTIVIMVIWGMTYFHSRMR